MTVLAKKIICLLLVPVICTGAFSGCSGGSADVPEMTLSDYVPKREAMRIHLPHSCILYPTTGCTFPLKNVRCGAERE